MLLHPHITPRLPTLPPARDPDPRRSPWARLSRAPHWLLAALLISLLLHFGALLLVLLEPAHTPRDDSRASSPIEWRVEIDKPSSSPPEQTAHAAQPPMPPPPAPAPAQAPQPAPKAPPTPAPLPAPAPVPEPSPIPAPPMTATQTVPAAVPKPPPPAPPASAAAAKPVIPLSPMISTSPFQQIAPAPKTPTKAPPMRADAMNLAIGKAERYVAEPPHRNPNDDSFDIQVTGAQLGSDWMRQLRLYWIEHRRYPQEAVINGDEGTVVVRFDVDRLGHVSHYEQLQTSGSRPLDLVTRATFANAQLPPFPYNTPENTATLTLSVTYSLIR
ncbi:MAG: energy transducer TonB [Acetobacteraceae bacterium]|nr:energy transducer TonB [Acetobacteraceae bacterium]